MLEYSSKLITAPTSDILTINDARTFLNIDDSTHDGLLSVLIAAAREHIEHTTGRRLVTQTHDIYLNDWPTVARNMSNEIAPMDFGDYIELPFGWPSSITYIKYRGTDGDWDTWSSSSYDLQDLGEYKKGRVYLAYNQSWPTSVLYPGWSIVVRLICGKAVKNIPQSIKNVTKLLLSEMFENRTFEPQDKEFFDNLLMPWILEPYVS